MHQLQTSTPNQFLQASEKPRKLQVTIASCYAPNRETVMNGFSTIQNILSHGFKFGFKILACLEAITHSFPVWMQKEATMLTAISWLV